LGARTGKQQKRDDDQSRQDASHPALPLALFSVIRFASFSFLFTVVGWLHVCPKKKQKKIERLLLSGRNSLSQKKCVVPPKMGARGERQPPAFPHLSLPPSLPPSDYHIVSCTTHRNTPSYVSASACTLPRLLASPSPSLSLSVFHDTHGTPGTPQKTERARSISQPPPPHFPTTPTHQSIDRSIHQSINQPPSPPFNKNVCVSYLLHFLYKKNPPSPTLFRFTQKRNTHHPNQPTTRVKRGGGRWRGWRRRRRPGSGSLTTYMCM
jgi:hypothetical protein